MRLHSAHITQKNLTDALADLKNRNLVGRSVRLVDMSDHRSRSHGRAIEFSLATDDTESFISDPVRERIEFYTDKKAVINRAKRRAVRQGKSYGDDNRRSATWFEWGHLIAYLFRLDPTATIGNYKSPDDFEDQTLYQRNAEWAMQWNGRNYPFMDDVDDVDTII